MMLRRLTLLVLLCAALPLAAQSEGAVCERTIHDQMEALTPEQRKTLAEEGAVFAGTLVLAAELAPNCELRLQLAGYLERAVQARSEAGDAYFAARHTQLVLEVARRLWSSAAFAAAQSGPHGRYHLLLDPNLRADHVRTFMAELLRRHGPTADLVWAMLERPMPRLRPALVEQLRLAEQTQNVHDQIYALALLHHLGDRTALPRLGRLRTSDQLSSFEREFLPKLVTHLSAGHRLTFAVLEPMELYNER